MSAGRSAYNLPNQHHGFRHLVQMHLLDLARRRPDNAGDSDRGLGLQPTAYCLPSASLPCPTPTASASSVTRGAGTMATGSTWSGKRFPNAKIVAVADADANGLAAAAKRLSVDQAFRDYREMLDKVKPDIVSICPRWIDQHRDMVVAAAERGIHMYMEKPLCRTLREADEMIAACERTHARLALAHQTHYSPQAGGREAADRRRQDRPRAGVSRPRQGGQRAAAARTCGCWARTSWT